MGNKASRRSTSNVTKIYTSNSEHYNISPEEQLVCTASQNTISATVLSYSIILENITILDISSQKIASINSLPFGLVSLNCSNNKLKQLPPLPETLISIDCSSNNITGTLQLNDNLEILKCMNNKINSIVTFTDINEENISADRKMIITKKYKNTVNLCPKYLKELNCHTNNLTELPKLNDGLENLFCENYNLKIIPALPTTLVLCDATLL